MNGQWRAFLRLLAVQGAWSYERMQGVGLGYAAQPLLDDLKVANPNRHAEAAIRSAEYFNSHPYLAGLALGATTRAEYDDVPGAQISRLRTALCGPLGALGDRLFWAGVLPALIAVCIAIMSFDHPLVAIGGFLLLYGGCRMAVGFWALRTGLATGMRVSAAITGSGLPRLADRAGLAAGLLIGIALPLASRWLLLPLGQSETVLALGVMLAGLLITWRFGIRVTGFRFGVLATAAATLLAWGLT